MKKELELEEKIKLLEKEISLLGDEAEKTRLDLEESVDSIKIDIESLKMVLKDLVPDFHHKFKGVRNAVLMNVDPEWIPENQGD